MGGLGSGRWSRSKSKATTENYHAIDIRRFKKVGGLRPGIRGYLHWSQHGEQTGLVGYEMGSDYMILVYRYRLHSEEWKPVKQTILLDRTSCNYGGSRTWFLCPQCGQRVAILYATGKSFLCRHCNNLTYASQQESEKNRYMMKVKKIRQRLGADNLFQPIIFKPKNMHQTTFDRLCKEADNAIQTYLRL